MTLANKILKTSAIYSLLSYLSFFFGIVGQILLARLIAPEFFVPFVTVLAFIEIIYAFGSIGLNNVLLTYQKEPKIFGTSFFILSFLAIFLFFLSVGASLFFLGKEFFEIIVLLSIAKSVSMYSVLFASFLEKDFKHSFVGVLEIISKIISVTVAVYLAYTGVKTLSLVYKEFIYSILFTGVLFIIVTKYIEYKFDINTARKVFNFSFKFFVLRLVEVSIKNVPILFLSKFSGNTSAYFERAYYLGGLTNTFFSPVTSKISYAFYAKLKDQLYRVKKGVYLNLNLTFRLILPITILIIFFSQEIILFIYGEKWFETGDYLQYLAGLFLFMPLFAILKFFLISHNHIKLVLKVRMYSIITLIIGIFYIYYFSHEFKYIAIIFSAIYFFSFIYLLIITNKKLDLDLKHLFLKPLIIVFLITPILFIFDFHWVMNSFIYLLLYTLLLGVYEKENTKEVFKILKGAKSNKP